MLNDINDNGTANVTAVADGDRIDLIDNTGGSGSLKVQEVDGGSTTASLGLAGINVAATKATGSNVYTATADGGQNPQPLLQPGPQRAERRGGRVHHSVLPDIGYTLANGDHGTIELAPIASGSTTGTPPTTLGEIVDEINAAAPASLPRRSIRPTTGSSSPTIPALPAARPSR